MVKTVLALSDFFTRCYNWDAGSRKWFIYQCYIPELYWSAVLPLVLLAHGLEPYSLGFPTVPELLVLSKLTVFRFGCPFACY
jgi:hypothetical protein